MFSRLFKFIFKTIFMWVVVIAITFFSFSYLYFNVYYQEFNEVRKIEDLLSGFIPQGLTYIEKEDIYLYAGYMTNGKASRIYISTNEGTRYVELYQKNGKKFTGHTGGIAATNDYIYLANDDNTSHQIYIIPKSELYNNEKVTLSESFVPIARASTCYVYDGYLWVGEYHDTNKYPANKDHVLTKDYNSFIAAYQIGEDGKITDLVPKKILATGNRLQGVAFSENGEIILSKSQGLNPSKIEFYKNVTVNKKDTSYKYQGKDIPVWYLEESDLTSSITLPPMSEEVYYKNGVLHTYFESATPKYKVGFLFGSFNIYTYKK